MDPDSRVGGTYPSRGSSESVDNESLVHLAGDRDRPSFTFIEHRDNLQIKRIEDAGTRKAIRSHVMRDIRRREKLSGVKRPTGKREKLEKLDASLDAPTHLSSLPSHINLRRKSPASHLIPGGLLSPRVDSAPGMTNVPSSTSSQSDTPNASTSRQFDQEAVHSQAMSTISLGFLDPFRTLPGDPPKRVGNIIYHCATVLIPMTFPVENKSPQEGKARLDHVVRSAMSHQAVFYTYMSFSSAHRALLLGEHSDLIISGKSVQRQIYSQDFLSMKARAINFLNKMMQDPEQATSDDAFEVVLMLMGTATMIGNFDEGRMHTKGLLKMAQIRGGVNQAAFQAHPHIMIAILNSHTKASCGTLTKPIFPIPWPIKPLSPPILSRIAPPSGSALHHLASSFTQIPILSPKIISLLLDLRDLTYLDDWNSRDPEGLSPAEHELVRTKSLETEHTLLSYPYDLVASQSQPTTILKFFHPLEMITRTAALLYECNLITVSLPASGIIRAMIFRFKRQLQQLGFQEKSKEPSVVVVDVLTWCLFIGAQNSQGEVERQWFVERLVELAKAKRWTTWGEVEAVMQKFLYVKRVSGEKWAEIWDEIQVAIE